MEIKGEAKRLRIFTGETDKVRHVPLYEAIVREARAAGLAGATVWKGTMGFGAASRIHTAKILDLSTDLPMAIEITDAEEKINAFLPRLSALIEQSGGGGLVTMEKVQIIRYTHGRAG
jgi:PII-like signaling protein